MNLANNHENSIQANGYSVYPHDIKTNFMSIIGHCQVKGNVTAKELINKGTTSANDCFVETVENIGNLSINRLQGEKIVTSGHLKCKGNVSAELFQSKGAVNIQGSLHANTIYIKITSTSNVDIVTSKGDITIKKSRTAFLNLLPTRLRTKRLKGEKIVIEHVEASEVVGDIIDVGPNCIIEKLYYKTKCDIHSKAKVLSKHQIR
ncbi:hypothetical protein EJF36_10030 [Bacillus sp. HMF5848]|uniref:hypothetical protein n=1 Tax=Bacillus sp. HMF5848 TaxID=2495421 RepID=UPI000F79EB6F|nr:hypothetical protein [Bacillus sp. HMF5848]RSK27189.1 hypothetical protein EJF36_10030 [Bacillus sp. HMF5848]